MWILSAFFLLGLITCVLCETCPGSTEIWPCTCKNWVDNDNIFLFCSDVTMSLLGLKQALKSVSGKTDVQLLLHGLKLGKVPSNFFRGIGIISLYIVECKLDSLAYSVLEPALLGLEDSLKELMIIASFTEENVPARLNLGHLRKLQVLKLSSNNITVLSNDWFDDGPTSLEYLIISDNGIKALGNRAFANLVNLVLLQLRGNRFGPILRSMFPVPAYRLNGLLVENNTLSGIPKDFFSNMPYLKYVSLYQMGISKLQKKIWRPAFKNLYMIDLRDNPLKCDSHMRWLFKLRVPEQLFGECKYPTDKNGTSLADFLKNKEQ